MYRSRHLQAIETTNYPLIERMCGFVLVYGYKCADRWDNNDCTFACASVYTRFCLAKPVMDMI